MTVADLLRRSRPDEDASRGHDLVPGWAGAVLLGAGTAAASAATILVPAVLVWSADDSPSVSFGEALGVAAALWSAALGARLHTATTTLAFVPLLSFAALVALTAYGLGRALPRTVGDGPWLADLVPSEPAPRLARWWAGYAATGGVVLALTRLGPLHPVWWSLAWPLLGVPLLALAIVAVRRPELVGPAIERVPLVIRRASGPAARGVLQLVLVGSGLVALAVLISFGEVRHVEGAVGAGAVGGLVLLVLQAAALPNLGLWALSALAGPGFQVVDGARTTLRGAGSGLLPMVPVFAALPTPRTFAWPVVLLGLVPVIVGGLIGRRALTTLPRLSSARRKAEVAVVAAVLAAAAVGVLDGFAGGALGNYRLADVGAPALALSAALAVELAIGALAVVARDAWTMRR